MADHPFFIGVGDGTALQRGHLGEGALHRRLHAREKILGEIHAADIDAQAERGERGEMFLEPVPELVFCWIHKVLLELVEWVGRGRLIPKNVFQPRMDTDGHGWERGVFRGVVRPMSHAVIIGFHPCLSVFIRGFSIPTAFSSLMLSGAAALHHGCFASFPDFRVRACAPLISTRLQPGVQGAVSEKPFQRFSPPRSGSR